VLRFHSAASVSMAVDVHQGQGRMVARCCNRHRTRPDWRLEETAVGAFLFRHLEDLHLWAALPAGVRFEPDKIKHGFCTPVSLH
jgi:hypothetical protein